MARAEAPTALSAYSVDANPTTAQRIGRLTIAGKDIYIHASRRDLFVLSFAGHTFCDHRGNQRQRWRDRRNWLCLDRREFRELADRLEWWQRLGKRHD